jgi:hypothetical protein
MSTIEHLTPRGRALRSTDVVLRNHVEVSGTRIFDNRLTDIDAQPAFRVLGNGKIEWGSGGASTPDTNLYRHAADRLCTDDRFTAARSFGSGMSIGNHPSYLGYGALWKDGNDGLGQYAILQSALDTFLNAPDTQGKTYFRSGNQSGVYQHRQNLVNARAQLVREVGNIPFGLRFAHVYVGGAAGLPFSITVNIPWDINAAVFVCLITAYTGAVGLTSVQFSMAIAGAANLAFCDKFFNTPNNHELMMPGAVFIPSAQLAGNYTANFTNAGNATMDSNDGIRIYMFSW